MGACAFCRNIRMAEQRNIEQMFNEVWCALASCQCTSLINKRVMKPRYHYCAH